MSDKGFKGFTLAEVLITLGVIGVVAAMTMPVLIQKNKEKQRVAQVKKAHSILSQAFMMAENEYGPIEYWDFGEESAGSPYVAERLGKYIKQSDRKQITFNKYLSLDGRNYNASGNSTIRKSSGNSIFLADGTVAIIGYTFPGCTQYDELRGCADLEIFLPEKVAQAGVSAFWFRLTPNGIIPYGSTGDYVTSFDTYCDIKNKSNLPSTAQGRGCTAWVLYNENMDYLHCNDLAWEGKHKCK